MNTGQMFLSICGLMLLSTLVLRLNSTNYTSSRNVFKSKYDVMAISLATAYLEEVKTKSFDEITVNRAISSESSLSDQLRPESGETRSPGNFSNNTYDDVDDYNNDVMIYELPKASSLNPPIYTISCQVKYYDPAINNTTTVKKFHKKITVAVTCTSMADTTGGNRASSTDTIKISNVFSYWRFR